MGGSTFATCPTVTYHLYDTDYTQDPSCYSLYGSLTSTSVACFTGAGWSWDSGYMSHADVSFTQSGVLWPNWYAGSYIYFDSPGGTAYDWIEILAVVTHNGIPTYNQVFYWDGTMGSLNGCAQQWGTFSAAAGDTITIKIWGQNSGTANIQASAARIGNY